MFYQLGQRESGEGEGWVSAIFVLTPAESKRLIAKAVAMLPEVRRALQKGRIIIARGTTTAFVAEEILGIAVPKVDYAAGVIVHGELRETPKQRRLLPFVLRDGQVVDTPANEVLEEFDAEDILIKGANAIDPWGNAGVLMANEMGGTIGGALPILSARGSHLIVPVGLEKMIPSVAEASRRCGIHRLKYATGLPVGYMPLMNALVVTEIQALQLLCGVSTTQVASGGIGGSEGAVVLVVEGGEERVERALAIVKSLKGEAPVPAPPEA